jgi:hypothetical protein
MNTLNPMRLQDLFTMGKNYLLSHNFVMARSCLEECLNQATDKTMRLDIHNLLDQCCFAMDEKDLSTRHFETGVKIDDQSERGLLITGFCLSWLGKHHEGISIVQKFIINNPKCIEAYVLQLKIYATLKNEEKKIQEMKNKITELELQKMRKFEQDIRASSKDGAEFFT